MLKNIKFRYWSGVVSFCFLCSCAHFPQPIDPMTMTCSEIQVEIDTLKPTIERCQENLETQNKLAIFSSILGVVASQGKAFRYDNPDDGTLRRYQDRLDLLTRASHMKYCAKRDCEPMMSQLPDFLRDPPEKKKTAKKRKS